MKKTRKLHQPRRARIDHAAVFERWCGYRLHPLARHIISILERQRAARQPQRVMVADTDGSAPLRCTLADYVRWRASINNETYLAVARTRRDLARLVPRTPRRTKAARDKAAPILGTGRSPDYCRGLDFRYCLIVDADRYPRRRANFTRTLSAVIPIIGNAPDTVLIVHGTYRPRTRTEHFTARVRRARADKHHTLWPLVDIAALSAANPDPPPDDEILLTPEQLLHTAPPLNLRYPYIVRPFLLRYWKFLL